MQKRYKIKLRGIVQGVGFRPFVYRTAVSNKIKGFILNNASGIEMEIQGDQQSIDTFLNTLRTKNPKASKIKDIDIAQIKPVFDESAFSIHQSKSSSLNSADICPDLAICSDCIHELMDSSDRRFHYPLINCTNCGPRYSIIRDIPYDRPNTTMEPFDLCPDCASEYHDPSNRRFHAQPVSCHKCGPSIHIRSGNKRKDIIQYAIDILKEGKIIGIKGIGGYHLACNAIMDDPVRRLREIKERDNKPFAVMVPNLSHAKKITEIKNFEQAVLLSQGAPITILKKSKYYNLSRFISPCLNTIGIMLPYTPLHFLLFFYKTMVPNFQALVMTSGNIHSRPLIKEENELIDTFGNNIYDIMSHDRRIANRIDDSVIIPAQEGKIFIRRSRGFAPFSLILPKKSPSILCLGSEKKNTIALSNEDKCYISQYIGDIKDLNTYSYMHETIQKFLNIYRLKPEIIAFDGHPLYENTKWALETSNIKKKIKIQHHRAHIASIAGEYNFYDQMIGIAFDGSGYGDDNNIWGGEFFIGTLENLQRAGHLSYKKLQGGDAGIREPYRTAIAYLYDIYGDDIHLLNIPLIKAIDKDNLKLILHGLRKDINTYLTSSIGRLFDAVSSMCSIRYYNDYEGQAAVELESAIKDLLNKNSVYPFKIIESDNVHLIDQNDIIKGIIQDLEENQNISIISEKFHNTIIYMILNMSIMLREIHNICHIALSGGVFQNRYIRERSELILKENGFIPMYNNMVSPGDEGISYGQAVISSLL